MQSPQVAQIIPLKMRIGSKWPKFVCGIALCWVFFSCTLARGYSGSTRPASELATIRGHGVTIHQVNDIEIGPTAPGVQVPGGKNVIYFTINSSNFNNPEEVRTLRELEVELRGGKEYIITGQRGDGQVCAWSVSTTDGSIDYSDHSAGCVK